MYLEFMHHNSYTYVPRVHAHSYWRDNMLGRLEKEKGDFLVGRRQLFGRYTKTFAHCKCSSSFYTFKAMPFNMLLNYLN